MGIENFKQPGEHNSEKEEGFLTLTKWEKWEIEGCNRWVREVLKQIEIIERLHGTIGAIICTETSGVALGYAIKAGLKELKGNEPMPKFLRINVKRFKNNIVSIKKGLLFSSQYEKTKFENSLSGLERKIDELDLKKKNFLILDEFTYSGNTVASVEYLLEKVGIDERQIFSSLCDYPECFSLRGGIKPTELKDFISLETGIVKGKEKREEAQKLIHDMKILGKLAAKE